MLFASISAHISLGAFLAFFFVLYYINGDGKWKVLFEAIIGLGGNVGIIYALDKLIPNQDDTIRMYSIASCFASFLIITAILLIVVSFVIKNRRNDDATEIIRLRDIMLGQYSFIKAYYESRMIEINNKLEIPKLEAREAAIRKGEAQLEETRTYIENELENLAKVGNKKLKLKLPDNKTVSLNHEYIDTMPSYIADTINCISDIKSCTDSFLTKPKEAIDVSAIKSYLCSIATYISSDLFGGTKTDARIHFRIYDRDANGYVKFVAIMGSKLMANDMTVIPYNDDNMIKKSFECKRALIKSINSTYDYKSDNYRIWQDYMTYTFYGLMYEDKPFLSFGISIKNAERYKKALHFVNYFRLENFLQENIERVNDSINIAAILYGGSNNVSD